MQSALNSTTIFRDQSSSNSSSSYDLSIHAPREGHFPLEIVDKNGISRLGFPIDSQEKRVLASNRVTVLQNIDAAITALVRVKNQVEGFKDDVVTEEKTDELLKGVDEMLACLSLTLSDHGARVQQLKEVKIITIVQKINPYIRDFLHLLGNDYHPVQAKDDVFVRLDNFCEKRADILTALKIPITVKSTKPLATSFEQDPAIADYQNRVRILFAYRKMFQVFVQILYEKSTHTSKNSEQNLIEMPNNYYHQFIKQNSHQYAYIIECLTTVEKKIKKSITEHESIEFSLKKIVKKKKHAKQDHQDEQDVMIQKVYQHLFAKQELFYVERVIKEAIVETIKSIITLMTERKTEKPLNFFYENLVEKMKQDLFVKLQIEEFEEEIKRVMYADSLYISKIDHSQTHVYSLEFPKKGNQNEEIQIKKYMEQYLSICGESIFKHSNIFIHLHQACDKVLDLKDNQLTLQKHKQYDEFFLKLKNNPDDTNLQDKFLTIVKEFQSLSPEVEKLKEPSTDDQKLSKNVQNFVKQVMDYNRLLYLFFAQILSNAPMGVLQQICGEVYPDDRLIKGLKEISDRQDKGVHIQFFSDRIEIKFLRLMGLMSSQGVPSKNFQFLQQLNLIIPLPDSRENPLDTANLSLSIQFSYQKRNVDVFKHENDEMMHLLAKIAAVVKAMGAPNLKTVLLGK